MIQLETRTVEIGERKIVVSENDWDSSRRLNRLTEEAKQSVNGGTSAFDFFRKHFYPLLAAVSSGDVPSAQAAFGLPRADLDRWYVTVWELNPDWISDEFGRESKTETVTFRDGSNLTVREARGLPSFLLQLIELEDEAAVNPSDDPDIQMFRQAFYPKMAACVIGACPDAQTMRKWPTTEISKLYDAAKLVNPEWFRALDELSEDIKRAQKEEEKKKEVKPAG